MTEEVETKVGTIDTNNLLDAFAKTMKDQNVVFQTLKKEKDSYTDSIAIHENRTIEAENKLDEYKAEMVDFEAERKKYEAEIETQKMTNRLLAQDLHKLKTLMVTLGSEIPELGEMLKGKV